MGSGAVIYFIFNTTNGRDISWGEAWVSDFKNSRKLITYDRGG